MIEYIQHTLAFAIPGGWEWIIILVVALLIFGKRLPDVARNIGKSLTEFKKGIREAKETKEDIEKDVREVKDNIVDQAKKATGLDEKDQASRN